MPSVVGLIRDGALDAELAALLWLMLEARVPVVVCGSASRPRRRDVLDALLALPQTRDDSTDATATMATDRWGPTLSARILALRPGEPFAAVVDAASLRELLAQATDESGGLTEDEARALGLVVVVGQDGRIDAAHLLRPLEVDGAGHTQRRPPIVLAARDPADGTLEHFAWGVMDELSDRVDRSQRDFERRQAGRGALLAGMVDRPDKADTELDRLVRALRAEPAREHAQRRPAARQTGTPSPPHVH